MKKNQYLMSLLLVILLSSCYTSRINYEKLSRIQLGMSSGGVIAILGKPTYRSFDEKEEVLEFCYGLNIAKIWFVDDKVTKMKNYYNYDCNKIRIVEDKKEDDKSSKKDKKEDTSSRIRVTTDGKHIIQTGSIIVTPDGKHETVVSDLGGIIITGSGEHIHVH